ncbi:hypothetical protein [Paenibacillus beijingensis]|uniref:Uncharacterized protein n=1 Tax=Paenibacillus beijingensis TaxID=1126833 RepID=A0A0D5NHN3_9BACL|nr:hypothetical protein [Paenibacillus beijingensis]AJY74776.1 hypothetical protein VN24_09485 [Paenibacillus beijingensis]
MVSPRLLAVTSAITPPLSTASLAVEPRKTAVAYGITHIRPRKTAIAYGFSHGRIFQTCKCTVFIDQNRLSEGKSCKYAGIQSFYSLKCDWAGEKMYFRRNFHLVD